MIQLYHVLGRKRKIFGKSAVAVHSHTDSILAHMSGWRMGLVASNPQFIEWILRVKSNIDSGMFRPMAQAWIYSTVMVEQMRSYIATVVERYKNRINAWDVVNEQIDENGAYRSTAWVNAIGNGDELMKLAFKFAHQYAPDAELYYNDFNVWRPSKRDGIARMAATLKN